MRAAALGAAALLTWAGLSFGSPTTAEAPAPEATPADYHAIIQVVELPQCGGRGVSGICIYGHDEPIDDEDPGKAHNIARAGDIRVDCDAPEIWCDDEGA